jgi:hypothetical protein
MFHIYRSRAEACEAKQKVPVSQSRIGCFGASLARRASPGAEACRACVANHQRDLR